MRHCGIAPDYTYLLNTCLLGGRVFHLHVSSHKLVITEIWPDGDIETRSVTTEGRFSSSSEWTHNLGACAFNGKIFVMMYDSSGDEKTVAAIVDPREQGGDRIRGPIHPKRLKLQGHSFTTKNWRFLVQYDDSRILLATYENAAVYTLSIDAEAATCTFKKYGEPMPDGMQFTTGLLAVPGRHVIAVGGTILGSNSDHRRVITVMTPKDDTIEYELRTDVEGLKRRCQTSLLLLYNRFILGFGGWRDEYLKDMFVYDLQTKSLSTVRSASSWHPGDSLSVLTVFGDTLYIIGGYKARSCYRIDLEDVFDAVRDKDISSALREALESGAQVYDPEGRAFALPEIVGVSATTTDATPATPAAPAAPGAAPEPEPAAAPVLLAGRSSTPPAPALPAPDPTASIYAEADRVRLQIAEKERELAVLRKRVAEEAAAHPGVLLDGPRFFPGAVVPGVSYRASLPQGSALCITCRTVPLKRLADGSPVLLYHRERGREAACRTATKAHIEGLPRSSSFRRAYRACYSAFQNSATAFRVFTATPDQTAVQTALASNSLAGERGVLPPGLAAGLIRVHAHTLTPQLKLRDDRSLSWWDTDVSPGARARTGLSPADAALLSRMAPPVASALLHLFNSMDPLLLERGMSARQQLIPDIRANRLLESLSSKSFSGGLGIHEAAQGMRRLEDLLFPQDPEDSGESVESEEEGPRPRAEPVGAVEAMSWPPKRVTQPGNAEPKEDAGGDGNPDDTQESDGYTTPSSYEYYGESYEYDDTDSGAEQGEGDSDGEDDGEDEEGNSEVNIE